MGITLANVLKKGVATTGVQLVIIGYTVRKPLQAVTTCCTFVTRQLPWNIQLISLKSIWSKHANEFLWLQATFPKPLSLTLRILRSAVKLFGESSMTSFSWLRTRACKWLLVAGLNIESHLQSLNLVFERLQKHIITANIWKLQNETDSLDFIGHVDAQGIRSLKNKVTAFLDYPEPTTVKQLRTLIFLTSFHRRFIRSARLSWNL